MKFKKSNLNIFVVSRISRKIISASIRNTISRVKNDIKHITRSRDSIRHYIYSEDIASIEVKHFNANILTRTVYHVQRLDNL